MNDEHQSLYLEPEAQRSYEEMECSVCHGTAGFIHGMCGNCWRVQEAARLLEKADGFTQRATDLLMRKVTLADILQREDRSGGASKG